MVDRDELDYGILDPLQEDARGQTAVVMAEHPRLLIKRSETGLRAWRRRGDRGYVPAVNYEKAGFPFLVHISCTVPKARRDELAEVMLEFPT